MAAVEKRWSDCLFVIIPGIGGSVLERRHGDQVETVWGGRSEALHRFVSPTELIVDDYDGIRAIGAIADWVLLRRFVVVHGYGALTRTVMNASGLKVDWGHPDRRSDDAQVVVFPWDFRRGIERAADQLDAEIRRRLDAAVGTQSRDRRVVIVAHSMGGLVARAWASSGEASRWCRGIITLGTPHLGAPKALRVMAKGLTLGPLTVAPGLSKVVQSWPSVYELLPVYRMINTLEADSIRAADLDVPWLNRAEANRALDLHASIRDDWDQLSDPPAMVAVTGIGRPTLEHASLSNGDLLFGKGPIGTDRLHGDGTVPRVSAVPHELNNWAGTSSQRISVGTGHGALSDWSGLNDELSQIVTLRPSGVMLGDVERGIALDLDAAWPAGVPLPLQARVFDQSGQAVGLVDGDEVATMRAHLTKNGVRGPWISMAKRDGFWGAEFPPQPPGVVTITVEASTLTGVDPLPVHEKFVAVATSDADDADGGTE
jgi:pimeloyl-ACP methyl ester carboxylesterase